MHYVYITANRKKGAIYLGQCDDLIKRLKAHKAGTHDRHCAKLSIDKLVWFEIHDTQESANLRERQLKDLKRSLRLALFKACNPQWDDLTKTLTEAELANPKRRYVSTANPAKFTVADMVTIDLTKIDKEEAS